MLLKRKKKKKQQPFSTCSHFQKQQYGHVIVIQMITFKCFQFQSSSHIFKCCNLCQQLLMPIGFQLLNLLHKLNLNNFAHFCLQVRYCSKIGRIFVITWKEIVICLLAFVLYQGCISSKIWNSCNLYCI